jgi:three-Cys-motif partner protein
MGLSCLSRSVFLCCKGRIKDNGEIVSGSPLIALNVKDPFDRYFFVEKNKENIDALRARCNSDYPDRNCVFIEGDCNKRVDEILNAIPKFHGSYRGLTFCFVDPYKTSDLQFSTIKALAGALYIDFLVLIPSFMDINRNPVPYTKEDSPVIDSFLGDDSWRECWEYSEDRLYDKFGNFIADAFGHRMALLGYRYDGINDMELIRMGIKQNLPLYHLAFFSRNDLGLRFWRETRIKTAKQKELDFGVEA